MHSLLEPTIELYKLNNRLFEKAVNQLNDSDADQVMIKSLPPINWIAGHICHSRYHILTLLENDLKLEKAKLYSDGFEHNISYPAFSKIKNAWFKIAELLPNEMLSAKNEILSKSLNYKLPHGTNNVSGAILFFSYHEAWHMGQISSICRTLELNGLAG